MRSSLLILACALLPACAGHGEAFDLSTYGKTLPMPTTAHAASEVDIRHFGAKVDGVSDDTVPVRLALAEAKRTGQNLRFPGGVCVMNGDGSYDEAAYGLLYLSSCGVRIVGDGSNSSVLKCGTPGKSGIKLAGSHRGGVVGLSIDMNGSSGFGLSAGGQYGVIDDVEVRNITGTRDNDADQGKIALIVPGSTLWTINRLSIYNCANHIYVGYSGENPSAPTQYITFGNLRTDPATTGFSIKIRYGTGITFTDPYLEAAPDRVVQVLSSNAVTFARTIGEIDGQYPLVPQSHFLIQNSVNVAFDGFYLLYSDGAPAGKDIFELSESVNSFSLNRATVIARSSIRDIIRSTATGTLPDNVEVTGPFLNSCVGGATIAATVTGAFNSFHGRSIAGAPIRANALMTDIVSCASDVYLTTGQGRVARVGVAASNKIFANDTELVGVRSYP